MFMTWIPMAFATDTSTETKIVLSDEGVTVNGSEISTDSSSAVYKGADIIYYESGHDSSYGASTDTSEQHTAEEAAAQTVVTITKAGTYRISGTLSAGQLAIDLGENAESDPTAVVTLILDGCSITCNLAPAVIFYNVYECDTAWVEDSDEYTASSTQDTSSAGANVILADGTTNTITGSHVAKVYKSGTTKKLYKYDGAFYSRMSMNIDGSTKGTGILNIHADQEGLDSELHLSINGGNINIYSQDDGINTNEDGVSVTTVNGGTLHIVAGLGSEGDGIDSNGWLVINGGTVISVANPASDSGLDSDHGSYINGGTVVSLGSTMDWAESDSNQVTMNLQFASMQNEDESIVITNQDGKVIFAYDPDQDEVTGSYLRKYQGAIFSSPDLAVGDTYYVYIGGTLTGTENDGIYDCSTITDYTGGTQQSYTGTDVGKLFGNGGGRPGDGMTGTGSSDNDTPPSKPNDNETNTDSDTTPPSKPDGNEISGDTSPQTSGQTSDASDSTTTASSYFYMTDKVNSFSGVTDVSEVSANLPFTDVGSSDWYYSGVQYVYKNGLMVGTGDKTFGPNKVMTRSMMVTILYRLAGSPTVSGSSSYSDAESNTWYSDAIVWAAENGIVTGYSTGKFGTNDPVTREQMATILYRFAEKLGYAITENTDMSNYTDYGSVSSYAKTAVQWAVAEGLISGTSTTTLSPQSQATRGQIATSLSRFANIFGTDENS